MTRKKKNRKKEKDFFEKLHEKAFDGYEEIKKERIFLQGLHEQAFDDDPKLSKVAIDALYRRALNYLKLHDLRDRESKRGCFKRELSGRSTGGKKGAEKRDELREKGVRILMENDVDWRAMLQTLYRENDYPRKDYLSRRLEKSRSEMEQEAKSRLKYYYISV